MAVCQGPEATSTQALEGCNLWDLHHRTHTHTPGRAAAPPLTFSIRAGAIVLLMCSTAFNTPGGEATSIKGGVTRSMQERTRPPGRSRRDAPYYVEGKELLSGQRMPTEGAPVPPPHSSFYPPPPVKAASSCQSRTSVPPSSAHPPAFISSQGWGLPSPTEALQRRFSPLPFSPLPLPRYLALSPSRSSRAS